MNEKINRLAKGMIDKETGRADIDPASFSETVSFFEDGVRELRLSLPGSTGLRGLCYSDNPRVKIETPVFIGNRVRVRFRIDTSFLKAGTLIFGRICFITNAGEYELPYRFTTEGSSFYDRAGEGSGECAVYDGEKLSSEDTTAADGPDEYGTFLLTHLPEDDELLTELCAGLIREQETGRMAFAVYEEAVRRDLRLTRLYEYYLYAFPDDGRRIPREVLLYFSYDTTTDPHLKAVLYKNILLYEPQESELYRNYEPEMRDYALSSVFRERIDENLAVIYEHMFYPDMIDERAAEVLPKLLKTCCISCEDKRMHRVLIRYPELTEEQSFPLAEGKACVPVYFPDAEILFLDGFGTCWSGVPFQMRAVMNRPDLLSRCVELNPSHPMVKLAAAREILKKDAANEQDVFVLRDVLKSLPLRRRFADRLIGVLIRDSGDSAFLSEIETDSLEGGRKQEILRLYLKCGELGEAFSFLRRYGLLIADKDSLRSFCTELLRSGGAPSEAEEAEQAFFLSALRRCFDEGARDREILSYLCRYYEGATEDMYRILKEAEAHGAELSVMPERVMITKLFSGVREHLDESFVLWERSGNRKEPIARAYYTVRANDYFTEDRKVPESFFESLGAFLLKEEAPEKLPSIYLMAWTRRFAGREEESSAEETALCQRLTDSLIEEGYVFAYMKKLCEKIRIPEEIADAFFIEYHGSRSARPVLYVKISPGDAEYRREELKRVYQGIYVRSIRLFSDDELSYLICEEAAPQEAVQQGVISGKKQTVQAEADSRYGMLEHMTRLRLSEDWESLQSAMQTYVLRDALCESLFDLR